MIERMAEKTAPPSDARTVQWAPHGPATTGGGKPSQASIGACDACRARKVSSESEGLFGNELTDLLGPMSCKRKFHVLEMSALCKGR